MNFSNILADIQVTPDGKGIIWVGEGKNRAGQDF